MILAKHGLLAGARLRQDVDEVRRVIVARTDGIALYDDVPLEQRDGAAALTATVLGLAAASSASLELDSVHFTATVSADGCLFVYPIDATHLLAVVTGPRVDTGALGEAALREVDAMRKLSGSPVAA